MVFWRFGGGAVGTFVRACSGMRSQAIVGGLDLDDDSMMRQPTQNAVATARLSITPFHTAKPKKVDDLCPADDVGLSRFRAVFVPCKRAASSALIFFKGRQ